MFLLLFNIITYTLPSNRFVSSTPRSCYFAFPFLFHLINVFHCLSLQTNLRYLNSRLFIPTQTSLQTLTSFSLQFDFNHNLPSFRFQPLLVHLHINYSRSFWYLSSYGLHDYLFAAIHIIHSQYPFTHPLIHSLSLRTNVTIPPQEINYSHTKKLTLHNNISLRRRKLFSHLHDTNRKTLIQILPFK